MDDKYDVLKAQGVSDVTIFQEMMKDGLRRHQGLKRISELFNFTHFAQAKAVLEKAYGDDLITAQGKLADVIDKVANELVERGEWPAE